jgi:hypothetical protein
VERAAALLKAKPMAIEEQLDAFHAEWMAR